MVTETGDYELSLVLDGLYYIGAKEALLELTEVDAKYAEIEKELESINKAIFDIEKKYTRREDAYDETEHLIVQLSGYWDECQTISSRLIRGTSTIHMLCASCLEAHINIRAQARLHTNDFSAFDKLSLYGKWLFYPKIIRISCFDAGKEPLQGLARLVKIRNQLVHFKGMKSYHDFGLQLPNFIAQLDLRWEAAEKSLITTRELVSQLAQFEQDDSPEWLSDGWESAFLTTTPAFKF